ncbi:MAG: TonB-dependent receptor plug domain-containing protein, partial [Spirosomataceae bacterium]
MKKLSTLILFTFIATLSMAQTAIIKGKLIDENGFSLPGAAIKVKENINLSAISDTYGNFSIVNLPAGTYTLVSSFIGYSPVMKTITTINGINKVDFILTSGVVLGDAVLVLGDRLKGQAKALNQQRTNANITNVVSSDQVGRFPDANIGDALKRIPGITMQNDQGEARDIIIRGMAPQLNSVTLNGERIPSAEGDNRRVQMDLIPADMIQTIQVNKAVLPNMDADAIGGSVNLVTRKAPNDLRVSGTLASGVNLLSDKPIYTGAFVLGNRILNDKLGFVLSGSYNNHQLGSHNVEGVWIDTD